MMPSATPSCYIDAENVFGPIVASSCLRGFDFTLLFEESILTILPLIIAVILASLRIIALWKVAVKVRKSWVLMVKLPAFLVYITLQIALLALWAQPGTPTTRITLATIACTIAGFIVLLGLSYLEHIRSVRPSTVMTLYLGVSCLLDLARLRTLFFVSNSDIVAKIFLASFFIKVAIFSLELIEKRGTLLPPWQDASFEATSSVYARVLFIWLNRLLFRGFRALLTMDSLMSLDKAILTASRPTALQWKWQKANKSNKNALLWVFLSHYKWNLLAGILPRLAYSAFNFTQPFLVQRLLEFINEPTQPNSKTIAYGLIGAYGLVYIGQAITLTAYGHITNRVLTIFRGSLITLIFQKSLQFDASTIYDAGAITLMSSDTSRIDGSIHVIHEVYSSVLELGVSLWLLYRLLGVAMVVPAAYMVLCIVLGMPVATAAGKAQRPWLEAIERRLAVTTKMLGSMKAIKMTGLAETMHSKVERLRFSEIRASRRHRVFSIFQLSVSNGNLLIPILGFATYSLLARAHNTQALTEGIAFAALGLFALQEYPLRTIITSFDDLQTLITSFSRIQEYLLSDERQDSKTILIEKPNNISPCSSTQEQEIHLNDLSSPLKKEVGSKYSRDAITIQDATAGYSPEIPVFLDINLQIPREKVTMIVGPVGSGKSTLLKLFLGEVPTSSGSVLTTFSKSAYCPQSPWIIWGTIQSNIIGMSKWDQLWYNTVVTACGLSADFRELPDGDQTRTGTRGSRLSGGQQMRVSLARALYSRNRVVILDDVLAGLDRATERSILDAVFGPGGLLKQSSSTVILTTNSASHLRYADYIIVLGQDHKIAEQGTIESISTTSEYIQELKNHPPVFMPQITADTETDPLEECGLPNEEIKLDSTRRTGDIQVYYYYVRVVGKWTILLYLFTCACCVFGLTFPSIWLQRWTNINASYPNENLGYWLGVYGAVSGFAILGCFASDSVLNLILVPKAARKFHNLLLDTTIRATTSFLTSTAAGKTTNRFSQDLELIDNDLPQALDYVIVQVFNVIISAVLICTGSGYVAAAIPLCIGLLYIIQSIYLRTSRQLRLLDIEAKEPLFSQFLETRDGISSIRAFGWTQDYLERSYGILDSSQKPYYLMKSLQRWLNLVLNLLVAGIAILLVAFATSIPGASTGYLGVAVFNVINLSSALQGLIAEWTQVEMTVGAVNRIRSYVLDTIPEDLRSTMDGDVPENWPDAGAITFDNVSASYESSMEPILQQISLTILPGEKIAICGRTGSGKSSLVSTLLRMLELDTGSITIDGVNIGTIPHQEVRRRLNTLPQEPFFLHGSVRDNVDPLHISNNECIIEALKTVQLWELLESRGGLDADISEELLSQGEKQLFCLARAIVKPSNIIIMDEATSSVDSETEELMQRVIRNELRGRTIIVIAHKLHTIMDFDRVVLLSHGKVIECGNPQELLKKSESSFHTLYMSME